MVRPKGGAWSPFLSHCGTPWTFALNLAVGPWGCLQAAFLVPGPPGSLPASILLLDPTSFTGWLSAAFSHQALDWRPLLCPSGRWTDPIPFHANPCQNQDPLNDAPLHRGFLLTGQSIDD